jgi:hypothetical protein
MERKDSNKRQERREIRERKINRSLIGHAFERKQQIYVEYQRKKIERKKRK